MCQQAIDLFLNMDKDFSDLKLMDMDWTVLEGLIGVLVVSLHSLFAQFLYNLPYSFHMEFNN